MTVAPQFNKPNEAPGDSPSAPLAGTRVVDFGQVVLAPFATRWLAWLGAEVILIESKKRSFQRATPPFAFDRPGLNTGARFNTLNNNKIACTINLKSAAAITLIKDLVAKSDVVVENYSSETMDKLGLSYSTLKAINPGLIYLSASAFGRTGSWRDYAGYHSSVNVFSGLAQITGYPGGPPRLLGAVLPDTIGGIYITFALLLALYHRRRTGEGRYIDFSMLESIMTVMPQPIIDYTLNGREWPRVGNRDAISAPHGIYPASGPDHWVSISVRSQKEWEALCRVAGRPAWLRDLRFSDELQRHKNAAALDEAIESWTREHKAEETAQSLQAAGVAAGAVLSVAQLLDDKHLKERGFIVDIEHPEAGSRKTVGLPWKIAGVPAPHFQRAPTFGEHNDYVFKKLLGLSDSAIRDLIEKGAIE